MQDLIATISRIHENANRFILNQLEEHNISGIAPSHGDILATLFKYEQCTMKELASKIHRTKATLTVLVDKLETLGFLTREKSAEDNRITYIRLTETGLALKPAFEKISQDLITNAYKGFTKEEIKTFDKLLKKINNNFQ